MILLGMIAVLSCSSHIVLLGKNSVVGL